jgi:hypothetical protein
MLLAETHDVVWQALIAGGVTIVLAWLQYRTKAAVEKSATVAAESADAAAVKAAEVSAKADRAAVVLAQTAAAATARTNAVAAKLDENTAIAVARTDAVAAKLDANTALTAATQDAVRDVKELVNGKTHIALVLTLRLAREVFVLRGSAEDAAVVTTAEKALAEYDARQDGAART